jgi:hypothetical protein
MILDFSRSAIKSMTQKAIAVREGVLLDGSIDLRQGQAKSVFYCAYSRSRGILAAKVYGAMYRQVFQERWRSIPRWEVTRISSSLSSRSPSPVRCGTLL